MSRSTIKWLLLLLLLVALFYWKILLTRQFSVLTEYEGANVAYAWNHFVIGSLKAGVLPLWDPYAHAGSPFAGEMQTAAFYPAKLVLAALPLNRQGLFSPQLFHQYFVLIHFLAGCLMFLLARDLGLSRFSALVAGACFSLAGMVGRLGWPDMLNTAVWLPLVLLFLLRAIHSPTVRRGLIYAGLAGLALGMAVLAGHLHVVMMEALVVMTAAAFFAVHPGAPAGSARARWQWAALLTCVVATVAFAAGALQLLSSLEYSGRAVRYLDAGLMLPARQKIAYTELSGGLWPRSILAFLFGYPFNGAIGGAENYGPYFGVLPLLLSVLGAWKNWHRPVVRHLAALAVLAFAYSLGTFSFLHGLLYPLVPYLWMAREPYRFIYLTQFSAAVLAGFGVETLFFGSLDAPALAPLARACKWVVIASLAGLAVPALFSKPETNDWIALSVLLILATYGLFLYISHGHRTRVAQFLVVALILCDLSAFNWTIHNKIEVAKAGTDHMEVLMRSRPLASFLKSRPGLFRTQVLADSAPDIGHVYGLQTTGGTAATLLQDFERFLNTAPHSVDLLNVRYFVKPKSAPEPGAIYEDQAWKVYENPNCYPRAWVVHEAAVEPSPDKLRARLGEPGFDPHRTALLAAPLPVPLEPPPGASPGSEDVAFPSYGANRFELRVRAEKQALLVLSEVAYPGWQATVNGNRVPIYKADGLFRAVVVPAGESRVTFRYLPGTVLAGAILSLLAFAGVLSAAYVFRRELASDPAEQSRILSA